MSTDGRTVVVGAGISGLSVAFWLHRAGMEVTVIERESWAGGTMRTLHEGGWLIETGPNSALETTPLLGDMFEALGITGERLYADASSDNRYILRDGRLHSLPMNPRLFLTSRLWTTAGKLRLLKEPFVGRATKEETIAEFVERRLGRELLDYGINPFVAGVYAGNPEQLSVRAAFPKLFALEENYGGLIKGTIKGARERKKRAEKAKDRAKMFSFRLGMQTFPESISRCLGNRLQLGCTVTSIVPRSGGGEGKRFTVSYMKEGRPETLDAGSVVIAVPAFVASGFTRAIAPALAAQLDQVYYPPVAEVFLGFAAEQIQRPLDGFGYLIPAKEQRNILGTIWSSSLFPGRAPAGHIALTTFVGGSRQPSMFEKGDSELLDLVLSDIRSIMDSPNATPAFTRIIRWGKAIPQYNLGYHRITDAVAALEDETPGLYFCSNFRGGIAVGDCVMNGNKIAERILAVR